MIKRVLFKLLCKESNADWFNASEEQEGDNVSLSIC